MLHNPVFRTDNANSCLYRAFIAALIVITLIALAILYVFSENKGDNQLHLAKSLIQFVVILLLGALVADVFKRVDNQRRDDERLAVFRNEIRKRLDDCY